MTDARDTTIMKWSDAGWPHWCDFAVSLQAELEAAYETTRAITADRDRARYEARSLVAGMAVVHFFDGLHAYALRVRIERQRTELRRLNVQTKKRDAVIANLRWDLIDAMHGTCGATTPAATATLNERHARVVEGPLPEHPPEDIRRPIPPSEPTIEGGCGLDTVTDADLASTFGACPDLPESCTECQEVTCDDCDPIYTGHDVEKSIENAVHERDALIAALSVREPTQAEGDACETRRSADAIPECDVPAGNHHGHKCACGRWVWGGPTRCQRCNDAMSVKIAMEWKERAERAERTLQRVREALASAYDLGAIPREHVTAAMRILDEESGR